MMTTAWPAVVLKPLLDCATWMYFVGKLFSSMQAWFYSLVPFLVAGSREGHPFDSTEGLEIYREAAPEAPISKQIPCVMLMEFRALGHPSHFILLGSSNTFLVLFTPIHYPQ